MYDLNETIELMTSPDYKNRFKAEYWQTKIRYDKLSMMLEKYRANKLDFEPTCPMWTLERQKKWMEGYLNTLEVRAEQEGIEL